MKAFDILIIGAGIHGAGVAQAAAAAGYSCCVLEQQGDIAQGTSRASSKLIHGGLRYLEQLQLALVRESLYERELLLRNAPQLVRRICFFIPVFEQTRRSPWTLRAGLSLYALLGGLRQTSRFRALPPCEWDNLDGLRTDGLRAVFRYFDAQTDDAQLTRAVMHSAQTLGAQLQTQAQVTGIELGDEQVQLEYSHQGATARLQAQVIVNASGAWSESLLKTVRPALTPPNIELVQGSHIVLDRRLTQGAYYVEAPRDGRAVFVMPWKNKTLIGTTETPYTGEPSACTPLAQEIDYLRETLVHYFPAYGAQREAKPSEAFAGLRVLPRTQGQAFERPRDTLFLTDREQQPRLVSVLGGKLTTYRATAEKLITHLSAQLPSRTAIADTKTIKLEPAP